MRLTNCFLMVFLVVGLAAGCYSSRSGKLPRSVDSYWHSLRWRAPGQAANLVHEDGRAEHMSKLTQELDNKRIVDHSLVNVTFDDANKKAIVQVSYSYYTLSGNDLVSAQEIQHWHFEKKTGWQLKTASSLTNEPQRK